MVSPRDAQTRPEDERQPDARSAARERRRQEAAERTRRDILEAALSAFGRLGFEATRLADIAEEAGFTAASLYTYFASKAEIVAACERLLRDEFAAELGPVPSEPAPDAAAFEGAVSAFLGRLVGWCARRRDGVALFWRLRWSGNAEALGTTQDELVSRTQQLLQHAAEVMRALGVERFSWLGPDEAAAALMSAVEGAILRTALGGEAPPVPARVARLVLHGLVGGPRQGADETREG
jgi:AcrR family transcriptional regulator